MGNPLINREGLLGDFFETPRKPPKRETSTQVTTKKETITTGIRGLGPPSTEETKNRIIESFIGILQ